VSEKDLGGKVEFGAGEGITDLVCATAAREGIGAHLARGSWRLAEEFGPESKKLLYAVKGLEMPAHSARGLPSLGLGYSVSTRGGSHHDTRAKYPEIGERPPFDIQPEYCVHSQNFTAVGDSLILCRFVHEKGLGGRNNEDTASLLRFVTGWDAGVAELETIGERIYTLERLINTERGVTRADDVLPHRVMTEPIPDGPAAGSHCPKEELDRMLDRYYELRGWDGNGVPTKERLSRLGLA
jgi:aldehyde:ferredoxin oxidoreductase